MKFWNSSGNGLMPIAGVDIYRRGTVQRPCPIEYVVFRSEDSRHLISKSSKTEQM